MAGAAEAPPLPPERRLPWRFVATLLANNFAQAVMLTLPFTLATYMVRDFLLAEGGGAAAAPHPAASTPAPTTAAVDERRVGELTGLLTAAYSLTQACTSIPWGRWSDRRGRRPVLLLAAAASAVSVAAFGLSGALVPALVARAAGGALNAFIGAWKTALAEAAGGDEGEQARVMALMGLSWGLGCVLGPATGGAAARPCGAGGRGGGPGAAASAAAAFPLLCGSGGLFSSRPYALPCLLVALVCVASGVMTWLWLPETLGLGGDGLLLPPPTAAASAAAASADAADAADAAAAGAPPACSDTSPLLPLRQQQQQSQQRRLDQDRGPAATAAAPHRVVVVDGSLAGEEEGDEDDAAAGGGNGNGNGSKAPGPQQRRPGSRGGGRGSLELQPTPSFSKFKRLPYEGGGEAGDDASDGDGGDGARGGGAPLLGGPRIPAPAGASLAPAVSAKAAAATDLPPPPPHPWAPPLPDAPTLAPAPPPWHHCPKVRHALAGYGLICLHFIALEELVPLWASAPLAAGGLARAPHQLALPLALNGAALVFFAALAYPPLRRVRGTVPLLRDGALLGAAVAALMPLPSLPPLLMIRRGGGPAPPAPPPPHAPLPRAALWLWLALMAVKAAAQAMAFTGAMIRVNVAGRRVSGGRQLGSVNGVGQTLASLARGLGPAGAGLSWAAAVALRESGAWGPPAPWLPPAQFAPFFAVAAVAAGTYWYYGRPEADEEDETEGRGGAAAAAK